MEKLRVAVIGCGRISVMHFDSILALDDVELVAVCDNKKDKADSKAKQYDVNAYYDYKEMLDNERLDSIHICLPHYLHTEVACYAFNKGVNVICEKPMDINYESAEQAVKLAKEKGVLYGIVSQTRYNNSVQLVKKTVKSGKLGKIISARSILTWARPDSYYLESDWKGTWDKEGGGVIIDQAIHSIDLTNWIIDSEVENVTCSMANRGHSIIKVEDTCEGLITYKNGVKYAFYAMNNYAVDEPIEIRLVCERGKVVFGYDDAYIYYDNGKIEEAHQDENVEIVEGGKDYWGFQHIRQLRQYYNAVRGKEPLELSGEELLKTHKVIMQIYEKGGMKK